MSVGVSDQHNVIMNFGKAPSLDDVMTLAQCVLKALPEELQTLAEDLEFDVQDFPDQIVEMEQKLEDPYDLLALYKSAKEIAPGVEKKEADGHDGLTLYRRSILDYWCESTEPFEVVLRQIIIEEIAHQGSFSDDEIDEMVSRHHQGLL